LQVGQPLGVGFTGGEVVGKSCSKRCLVVGLLAGSISRTGGITGLGQGTGSGGESVAQPASQVAATSIGSIQPSREILFNVASNFTLSPQFFFSRSLSPLAGLFA
jgi:hypothetical protein